MRNGLPNQFRRAIASREFPRARMEACQVLREWMIAETCTRSRMRKRLTQA